MLSGNKFWITAAVILVCNASHGALFKCTNAAGKTVYQDQKCPDAIYEHKGKWVSGDYKESISKSSEFEKSAKKQDAEKARAAREAAAKAQADKENSKYLLGAMSAMAQAVKTGNLFVEYYVEGSASEAHITYNGQGGGVQQKVVSLPWREYMIYPKRAFTYISAQNKDNYGNVEAQIRIGGVLQKTAKSSAPFGIATVSGKFK